MRCRLVLAVLIFAIVGTAWAGHTRPGYVDGCQSINGRFVVTAKYDTAKKQWQYIWQDKKENKTLTGPLVSIPDCQQGHFDVSYVHLFVAPEGETFAAFNAASWSGYSRNLPKIPDRSASDYRDHAGFKDRVVVYKKTGEVVKRLGIKDILKDGEWDHVHHVQGNLYWLGESPDYPVKSIGEPPRMGYRYYRISPDYTVLELNIAPDREVQAKFKSQGKNLANSPRMLRIDLTTGSFLADAIKLTDVNKIPVKAYQGAFSKRGDDMKGYVPSLDPVRVAGNLVANPKK